MRRQAAGHLETKRVTRSYRRQLGAAWEVFQLWLGCMVGPVEETVWEDAVAADEWLTSFVEYQHAHGAQYSTTKYAILAAQYFYPWLKGSLRRAWTVAKAWGGKKSKSSRPPIPKDVALAAFLTAFNQAMEADSRANGRTWCCFAILVLLGFRGLLRPGEIYKRCRRDLVLINRIGMAPALIVCLTSPKTRGFAGRTQFVIVKDLMVIKWAVWCFWSAPPHGKLWASSDIEFRKRFALVLAKLRVSGMKLTPGSLRPGGATDDYTTGESIE